MKLLILNNYQMVNGVTVKNRLTGEKFKQVTDYVFIGAGGGAIPLLQKQVSLKVNI